MKKNFRSRLRKSRGVWTIGLLLFVFSRGASFAEVLGPSHRPFHALHKTAIHFLSGKKIMADIANTPKERERGLMFRKTLPKKYGMLFVFPRADYFEFWMKNTWVDLDMVYIGKDKKITAIYPNVAASTPRTPDEDVARVGAGGQYVLELPSGAARRDGLKVGQSVKFKAKIPKT